MAATEVARLVVELEARVTKLESGMGKATRSVTNFERRATSSFGRVGSAFRHLALRFTGITALIASAAGTFSAVQFVKGSIEAAAAVDTFEVRLRNLVGSGERTKKLFADLREFASKIAPTLRDTIEAAAVLGTVAPGAPERIMELTKAAANIAAVTGLTMEQASQNLQRLASQGIGAADLFRERGVRAIIEAMTGIPNLLEKTVEEQLALAEQVFGPGGVFGLTAEQFSQTLPGAMSNTVDALFNLQSAFGEAISPAIIAILKEVIIPAFGDLEKLIKGNEVAIRDYAMRGLKTGILGLVELGRALLEVVRLITEANSLLKSSRELFAKGQVKVAEANLKVNEFLGPLVPEGVVEQNRADLEAWRGVLGDMQGDAAKAEAEVARLDTALAGMGKALDIIEGKAANLGDETAAAAAAAAAEAEEFGRMQEEKLAAAQRGLDPRLMQDIEAATARTVTLLENSAIAAAKGRSEFEGRRLEIDKENRKLQENLAIIVQEIAVFEKRVAKAREAVAAAKNARDQELANITLQVSLNTLAQARAKNAELIAADEQRITDNARERAQLDRDEAASKKTIRQYITDIKTLSGEIAKYDTVRSEELNDQLSVILNSGKALEEQKNSLRELFETAGKDLPKVREEFLKPIGEDLSAGLTDAVSGVFQNLRDPAKDFAEYLADISSSLLDSAISSTMDSLQDKLKEIFESMELSKGMETTILGAAGIAIGLISGAFRDTEIETSADKVASAITNVQQVRGVVAGPTQIGIAQVGETIENAFVETNFILRHGTDVLERILAAVGGRAPGIAQVATSTETALGATGPSLA
jgi:hypothetical protein